MQSDSVRLRAALSEGGRPDFVPQEFGNELAYPEERVLILIRACLVARCPLHRVDYKRLVQKRAAGRIMETYENRAQALEAAGWTVIDLWSCQVRDRISDVVEVVLATLADKVGSRAALTSNTIGILHTYISSRYPLEDWRMFLAGIATLGWRFRKMDAKATLVHAYGLSEHAFRWLWNTAREHRVIVVTTLGGKPGPLMEAACAPFGVKAAQRSKRGRKSNAERERIASEAAQKERAV